MNQKNNQESVETRLSGSRLDRFWQELLRNTGQFPIGIVLIEFLRDGWGYLGKPDLYVLLPAAAIQAYWLSHKENRPGWQRFAGNLITPLLYTAFEMSLEGWEFFTAPHHAAYWVFACAIGLLQALQSGRNSIANNVLLVLENMVRSQILFAAYYIFEIYSNPSQTISLTEFFSDPSHLLMGLATLLLGFSAGLADVNASRFLSSLKETASRLKTYSEWLLGRDLLGRALNDPDSMRLTRKERTILFMDIRGFTRWSEPRAPEDVAALLNGYYALIEKTFEPHQVIKYKFTADEVMAVFTSAEDAVAAARELRVTTEKELQRYGLGAGIGIHTGTLVEGLLGGEGIRFYDVIGDTVNTTQRIESAAGAGEIWISGDTLARLSAPQPGAEKEISVKGKEAPIKVYSVQ